MDLDESAGLTEPIYLFIYALLNHKFKPEL